MDKIMEWLGTPYRFGGTSEHAIDCSGWTQRNFLEVANIALPRTAREQINVGQKVNRKNLEFGDLVFSIHIQENLPHT
jgi:cell wall-associated NlpC family hydrolase